jgi:hypothetical protein
VSTPDGLLNVVMVGNLLEMAEVINRNHYSGEMDDLEEEEEIFARLRYRRFCTWFAGEYVTILGGIWVHPSYIFKRALLQFCLCLIFYKRERQAQLVNVPLTTGCTSLKLERLILAHFETQWPELMPLMETMLDDEAPITSDTWSFNWTGPMFKIARRNSDIAKALALTSTEKRDFPREPIYSPDGDMDVAAES